VVVVSVVLIVVNILDRRINSGRSRPSSYSSGEGVVVVVIVLVLVAAVAVVVVV